VRLGFTLTPFGEATTARGTTYDEYRVVFHDNRRKLTPQVVGMFRLQAKDGRWVFPHLDLLNSIQGLGPYKVIRKRYRLETDEDGLREQYLHCKIWRHSVRMGPAVKANNRTHHRYIFIDDLDGGCTGYISALDIAATCDILTEIGNTPPGEADPDLLTAYLRYAPSSTTH